MSRPTYRTIVLPLARTSTYAAATREVLVYREETPRPASNAPIRSPWPTVPYGKALTDARIRAYEAEGRYGVERQQAALARETAKQAAKRRNKQKERFMNAMMEKYA